MAKVVETEEPVVRERQTVVREERPRSVVGTVLVIILVLIVLFVLFAWSPWSGGSSNTTNVNVPAPKSNY
jgi:hypothetical protein